MVIDKSKRVIAIIIALCNFIGYLALINFDMFLPIKELMGYIRGHEKVSHCHLNDFLKSTKKIRGNELETITERTYIIGLDISKSLMWVEKDKDSKGKIPQWAKDTTEKLKKIIGDYKIRDRITKIKLYETTDESTDENKLRLLKNARILCKYKLFLFLLDIIDSTGTTHFSLWELGNEADHIYPKKGPFTDPKKVLFTETFEENIEDAIIKVYDKEDDYSISSNFTSFFEFLLSKFKKMRESEHDDTKLPLFSLVLISDLKHDIVDIKRKEIEDKFKNYSPKEVDKRLKIACENDLMELRLIIDNLYKKDVFFQIIIFPSIQEQRGKMGEINKSNVSDVDQWDEYKVSVLDELRKVGFGKFRMREISLDKSDFKLIAPPVKSTRYIDFLYKEEKEVEKFSYKIEFDEDGEYILGLTTDLNKDFSYFEIEKIDFFYQMQNSEDEDITEEGYSGRLKPGELTGNIKMRGGEGVKLYFSGRPFGKASNLRFPGFELYLPQKERYTVVIPMRFKEIMKFGKVIGGIIVSVLLIVLSLILLVVFINPFLGAITDRVFNFLNKVKLVIKKLLKDLH